MEGRTLTSVAPQQRAPSGLGTRLRQLRVAAGLTQSDLAGERFSKEYVSQIERGKTRPTPQTLDWIAERLGVDSSYLETGQTWDEYAEVEAAVTRAEAAVEGQRFDEVLEALEGVRHSPEARELETALLPYCRQAFRDGTGRITALGPSHRTPAPELASHTPASPRGVRPARGLGRRGASSSLSTLGESPAGRSRRQTDVIHRGLGTIFRARARGRGTPRTRRGAPHPA